MKRVLILIAGSLVLAGVAQSALAFERLQARHRVSTSSSWHQGYYDPAWGVPVSVVVPPTAEMQTHWNWGVSNTRITPLNYQFQRGFPGFSEFDYRMLQPPPPWPSSTDQLGDYYIRGPW